MPRTSHSIWSSCAALKTSSRGEGKSLSEKILCVYYTAEDAELCETVILGSRWNGTSWGIWGNVGKNKICGSPLAVGGKVKGPAPLPDFLLSAIAHREQLKLCHLSIDVESVFVPREPSLALYVPRTRPHLSFRKNNSRESYGWICSFKSIALALIIQTLDEVPVCRYAKLMSVPPAFKSRDRNRPCPRASALPERGVWTPKTGDEVSHGWEKFTEVHVLNMLKIEKGITELHYPEFAFPFIEGSLVMNAKSH